LPEKNYRIRHEIRHIVHATTYHVSFRAGMLSAVVIALQSEFPELVVNAAKVMSNLARDKDMQVHPAPQAAQ